MLGTRDKKLSNNSIKNDLIIIKMRKLCQHCYLAEIMPVCSNYAKNYASIIYKCLILMPANERVHIHNKRNFPQAKFDNEINVSFLLI